MNFLIDMPLSPDLAPWLTAQGHDAVHAAHVGLATAADADIMARARAEGRIVVTLGDIQKKYAKKMEYLAEVWDGSEKEKGPGYWLMEVEGYHRDGQRFGIWFDGWSQAEPDFVSRNKVIMAVVEQVVQATDGRGVSVFDRGFDGEEFTCYAPFFLNEITRSISQLGS